MPRFFLSKLATALFLVSAVAAHAHAQLPYITGGGGAPAVPAAPTISPSDRDALLTPEIRASFPRMGENFTVVGPSTKTYNAYAHVMGLSDRWLAPEAGTADNPFAGVDKLLGQAGLRRTPSFDMTVQSGRQKVVVFGTIGPDGSVTGITSAALQQPDGSWTSKIGSMALIKFSHVEAIRGPTYGLPVAVYEREVSASIPFAIR